MKKLYTFPNLEFVKIRLIEDVLSSSKPGTVDNGNPEQPETGGVVSTDPDPFGGDTGDDDFWF